MAYLNHPLRAAGSEPLLRPSLELLREIQRTGDIFFPSRWVDSALWGHRSPAAMATVQDFLASELSYPERLRWTILSAADELFRTASRQAP
jgi:aminopeptidase N